MITCGNRREMHFTKEENEAIAEELVEELREYPSCACYLAHQKVRRNGPVCT